MPVSQWPNGGSPIGQGLRLQERIASGRLDISQSVSSAVSLIESITSQRTKRSVVT